MLPTKLLPFFILFTALGLLVTHQQVAKTLLLYQIHDQERLARRLDDEHQVLNYQVNTLASPKRLTSVLAQKSLSLDGPPVAVVKFGTEGEKTMRLAKRRQGLLERLSLIRVAEAHSR